MAKRREAQQVAKRAVILSTMAFRSSLEVTSDPRVSEISQRLLPWLGEVECDSELDPTERQQLATPIGQLSQSQLVDVRRAGEGAAFLCWTLSLAGELEAITPADPWNLPTFDSVLKPRAADIIASAVLRDWSEIEDACRQFVLIVSLLRESRVTPPASEIIRRIHVKELDEAGVPATEDSIARASKVLSGMTSQQRSSAAGFYVIRRHVATWFLSDRSCYFV